MKYLLLSLSLSLPVLAQYEAVPDSPLDSSVGEASKKALPTKNVLRDSRENEQQREEELLENRYDVPDDKEEEEFNKNGP